MNRTQIWVCETVGIDRTTYQNFERGTSDPHLGDLLLIAEALEIDVGDLVRGQHRPPQ